MKRPPALLAALLALAAPAAAQFEGPGAGSVNTVAEAKAKDDDTSVILRGTIVRQTGPERYIFRDGTGELQVDIDKELWKGRKVTPEMVVQIEGDVDQSLTETIVEADTLRIIEEKKAQP